MATVGNSPNHSPNYTPTTYPKNNSNNPVALTRVTPPIPYIKYPKPPATLNLNIQNEPTYAQTLTSPTGRNAPNQTLLAHQHIHASPSPPPPRYQLPPWINFLDQNPWSAHITPEKPRQPKRLPLPLPPVSTHRAWRGRCFNCLEFGHEQSECNDKERMCAFCWVKGHEARNCPEYNKAQFDPMRPMGNLGEEGLPSTRPDTATVYIPETHQMRYNAMELRRALIVDARLKAVHNPQVIQSVLMAVTKSDFPFQLTHMQGAQYILLLPHGADRHNFLKSFAQPLEDLGFVTYPWSEGINGEQLILKYRVWIELENVTPQAWTLDHLIPALSSFGVLMEHANMRGAPSLQKLRAVIAVDELEHIPRSISMWIRGIKRRNSLSVLSWINEPVPLPPMADTTPPPSYFERVQKENAKAISVNVNDLPLDGRGVVVDFDTLFSVWYKMAPCAKKEKIGLSLRASPHFDQLLSEHEARDSEGRSSAIRSNPPLEKLATPSNYTPQVKGGKKDEIKGKGKAKETSSASTGEVLAARKGHLVINEKGAGSDHISDTNHIMSAPTEQIQFSNQSFLQVTAQVEGPNQISNIGQPLQGVDPQGPSPITEDPSDAPNWADEPLTQMSAAQISPFKGNNQATGPPPLGLSLTTLPIHYLLMPRPLTRMARPWLGPS